MPAFTAASRLFKENRRWTIVGLLSWIIIVDLFARSNLGIAIPAIRHEYTLSNLQVGTIFSVFQLAYALSHVPMGLVVDRFGPRRVILFAGLAWTVFAAATGFVTNFATLLAMRIGLGITESPVFPAGIKIVDAWFPNREKAMAVAMYEVAVQIGFAGAPLLGALILVSAGWREMFVAMALLSLIPLVIWFFRYQEPEDDKNLTTKERNLILAGRSSTATTPPEFAEWLALFKQVQPWGMVAGGVSNAMLMGAYLWLPIYLQQSRHFSVVNAGGSLSLFGLAGIAGVVAGALLSDRLINRGGEVLASRRKVLVLALLLASAAITCTTIFQSNTAMLITISIGYFGTGLGTAPAWALVPAISPNPKLVASLGSLQNGGWQLGLAISPLVIGWFLDHGLDFHFVLGFSAGFAVLSAFIYGALLRSPMHPYEVVSPPIPAHA